MSSYETVVVKTMSQIRERGHPFRTTLLKPFYADPDYIDALHEVSRPDLESGFDHLLFTFHGVPERHLRKSDPSHEHCMTTQIVVRLVIRLMLLATVINVFALLVSLLKRPTSPKINTVSPFSPVLGVTLGSNRTPTRL